MSEDVDRAVAALRAGGVVLLPTDTIYGIAALPTVPGATEKLFALKDRSAGQPLAVLVADAAQARSLAVGLSSAAERVIAARWPGPLTVVVERSEHARGLELGGDPATVGIRCPDHALIRAIAAEVGPIATTSANRHGEPTPSTAPEAAAALTGPVAALIDGGVLEGLASTVVDLMGADPKVLREGAISRAEIDRLLAEG